MSLLNILSGLLSKAAKNPTIRAAVVGAALKVAAANVDKAGAKLKVPTEVTDIAKAVLVSEAVKAGDLAAVQGIKRL